jgi:hypothetical protein
MPRLDNGRYELFAQAIAAGRNGSTAYAEAGYSAGGNAAESGASRLLSNAKIADRIAELRKDAIQRLEVDRAWVMARLVRTVLIATGEEKLRVRSIKTVGRGDKRRHVVVEEEVTAYDAAAALRGIELIAKAVDVTFFEGSDGSSIPPKEQSATSAQNVVPDFAAARRKYGGGSQ